MSERSLQVYDATDTRKETSKDSFANTKIKKKNIKNMEIISKDVHYYNF
jgi:hypothetical protein